MNCFFEALRSVGQKCTQKCLQKCAKNVQQKCAKLCLQKCNKKVCKSVPTCLKKCAKNCLGKVHQNCLKKCAKELQKCAKNICKSTPKCLQNQYFSEFTFCYEGGKRDKLFLFIFHTTKIPILLKPLSILHSNTTTSFEVFFFLTFQTTFAFSACLTSICYVYLTLNKRSSF